jgi:hypothetical protein
MVGGSMRKYEHDTSYYGGDILRAVRRVIPQTADLDRGGVYVWSVASNKNAFPLIVYLNMNENDGRGSMECHRCGNYKSQISYEGILSLNEDKTDCVFDANKILEYLELNLYEG